MLPQRRLELYLAQIALLVAQTMGDARDAKLTDFLFDPPEDVDAEPADELAAAIEFFGFAPCNAEG